MGRIDDEPNPKWDEWAKKPLTNAEKERILRAVKGEGGGGGGGGGGGSSSGCLLLILAALTVVVAVVLS